MWVSSRVAICRLVLRSDQQGVEAIGRAIGSDVAQVCGDETVFIRNLVIDSGCEEVLADDLLAGKGEYSYIPVCPGLNAAVREGPQGKIFLGRRVHACIGVGAQAGVVSGAEQRVPLRAATEGTVSTFVMPLDWRIPS